MEGGITMNELIKVSYENDNPTVLARDLHDFLEVSTKYADWFPRMCEYGFSKGTDFNPLKNERVQNEGGRTVTRTVDDAQLTISMAKEICMIQRNNKGKIARQYFLKLEEAWNTPESVMARAIKMADAKINSLQTVNLELAAEIERKDQLIGELKPKADYVDFILSSAGTVTTTQIAADYCMSAQELNKVLCEEKIQRKVDGQWILYKDHMGLGYTKSETIDIVRSNGRPDVKMHTKWTQKGRLMINEVLNRRGLYANMDLIAVWDSDCF